MKFTDMAIRNLKPKESKYYVRADMAGKHGLALCVYPSGGKTWFFIYTFEEKRFSLSLGNYPDRTLAEATVKFDEYWKLFSSGRNPALVEDEAREERRKAPTVADLADEYIKKHAKVKKKSWEADERALAVEVVPKWGKRKAADIRKRDVVLLLEEIVERGSPVMSNRVRALLSKMFNFGVDRDIVEANPCSGVKALAEESPRERHLCDEEIKVLWNQLDTNDELVMSEETKRALKLILVTAQRPGEVSGMHRNELEGCWWTIPVERSKNGKSHRVYLTGLALELIGGKEGFIFESPKGDMPIDEKGLARALRRNIKGQLYKTDKVKRRNGKEYVRGAYRQKASPEDPNRLGIDFFTPHDLRRTAATHMAESGVLEEIVDRVLNHSRRGVTWTYNRYPYQREIQAALEAWERKLKMITTGVTKGAKVLPLIR